MCPKCEKEARERDRLNNESVAARIAAGLPMSDEKGAYGYVRTTTSSPCKHEEPLVPEHKPISTLMQERAERDLREEQKQILALMRERAIANQEIIVTAQQKAIPTLFEAVTKLFSLPNWNNRIGDWKDINIAINGVLAAYQVEACAAPTKQSLNAEPSLRQALQDVVKIANEIHDHWDADNDSKVGKLLMALSGHLPGYRHEIDVIHQLMRQTCPSLDVRLKKE